MRSSDLRRRFWLGGCFLLLSISPAWAQSKVEFTLGLGGDNHAAAWKSWTRTSAFPRNQLDTIMFTPGDPANDQVFAVGSTITWDVRVKASGTQVGNPGAGQPIFGVANVVFDLELHQGTAGGPLATIADFKSTINDGNNGDVMASAAFPLVYDLGSNGPGRLVDPYSGYYPGGGPHCGGVDATRPNKLKSATYPLDTPNSGKLVGMGAGYNYWSGALGAAKTTAGIGMVTLPGGQGVGLGELPICEGQISTTGMVPGTYVLVVNPADGINVLRGDVSLSGAPAAFATAADGPNVGDEIRFILDNQPGPPTSPSPASPSSNIAINPTLTWTRGAYATSFDVYFGTASNPPLVASDQGGPAGEYIPSSLQYGTQYYWRIVEKNGPLTTSGPVWTFTTIYQPGPPSNPAPGDTATDVPVNVTLTWTRGANATSYDVRFGTTNPPPTVASDLPGPAGQYTPSGLQFSTEYFWQIVEKNGSAPVTEGPVWRFTTWSGVVGPPTLPIPDNEAVDVEPTVVLTWTRGANAATFDVYLGTDPGALTRVAQDQPGPDGAYVPAGLQFETQYFWQIVEKNGGATPATGPVWSFTTVQAYTATAWRSVRVVGSNSYGVTLSPLGGEITSEPRIGQLVRIEVDLNQPSAVYSFPLTTGSDGSHPGIANMQMANDDTRLVLDYYAGSLAPGVCYAIDISETVYSVVTEDGRLLDGGKTCSFRVLPGDTTGNGVVNLGDALYVRTMLGQAVDDSTARFDVNADGVIDENDMTAAIGVLGGTTPSCP